MTKKELREKYKMLRNQLSNGEQAAISQKVADLLKSGFMLPGKKISCFIPISRFHEINTWLILDAVEAEFYLPVIGSDDQLKHIRYEGKDKLKENSWGILEPFSGQEVKASELDIVLVPLLTLDGNGFRVGYGKGYYDQFLSQCKPSCIFIGLYQFENFETIDDIHRADIPVHYCVSPAGITKLS